MNNTRGLVLVIGVLLILALTAFAIVALIQNAIQRTVSPVESMTGSLSTQVSSFLNPTPTILPDPITIVREVRSLSRLETIQYTLEKVITAESGQLVLGNLFGDKLLLVAHGVVIAGIDMSKLGPDDIWQDNGVLYVRLPEPEIFISTLDNEKSYVYDRDTGIFTKGDVNLETAARRVAEDEIKKAAIEDGILSQALLNAQNYLYRLLTGLGYPEIIFIENTPTPTP